MFGMRKFLIAFIALGLAKHFPLYGVYPPAKEVLRQLCGEKGLDSTFKQAFWEVWEGALPFGFQNFPILGEKQGLITFFDKDLEPFGTSVSQKQKVDSIWGEFSWKLNGTEISKAEQIWSAIEKKHLSLSDKGRKNLTKVCQTLLSGRFAEKLLGEGSLRNLRILQRKTVLIFQRRFQSLHVRREAGRVLVSDFVLATASIRSHLYGRIPFLVQRRKRFLRFGRRLFCDIRMGSGQKMQRSVSG